MTKSFRRGEEEVHALTGVDLIIREGEFVSIVGRSGSGKSTLLHLAGGFTTPDVGTVHIGGMKLAGCGDRELSRLRRTKLGFVFQFFHLLPALSVWENVALPLVAHGQRDLRGVDEKLDLLGLSHRRDHRPRELSGGEMQRTAIARALVFGPSLVVADEPTGNLDSATGNAVIDVLTTSVSEVGAAVLLVTHDERIASLADRRLVLRDGALL
ncbi:MAG: ABC transporter ATP-binding protein [Acidimicrobiia bacterium]|nr:ABC transporter ATP-binding protein [Acidimicrobiia bacterium]